ncbi:MAG: YwmB family TATA-box binding protein [Corallococcus sp.]|nr:YwmB family TATA-box binding protein [Corallococcus sp.]MCM1360023.1 YwmB family TATA-box binding protein [Corallococcus sp.]MCM1395580.1 YwmB family TATA-box binding protein [Corallococcus sp.]
MKKAIRYFTVLALCAIVIGVMLVYTPRPFVQNIRVFPPNAKVAIYCKQTDSPFTEMGNGRLVECTVSDVDRILAGCNGIDGLSVKFAATQSDFDQICRYFGIREVSRWQSGNLVSVCGLSDKICGGIDLCGEKVNVQAAFDGNVVTVGFPLILDSY